MRKIKVVVLLVQQLQHGFTKNAKVSPNLTVAHIISDCVVIIIMRLSLSILDYLLSCCPYNNCNLSANSRPKHHFQYTHFLNNILLI